MRSIALLLIFTALASADVDDQARKAARRFRGDTFSFSTTSEHPLGIGQSIEFYVWHEYDKERLDFEHTYTSWQVTGNIERTFTQEIVTRPAMFPDLPVTESRTVHEHIAILEWPTATVDVEEPFLRDGKWYISLNVEDEDIGDVVLRRTLTGPDSTTSDIIHTQVEGFRGTRRLVLNDEWEPLGPLVLDNLGPGQFWIPGWELDGVSVDGYWLSAVLPIVPEPSAFWLLLLSVGGLRCCMHLR